MANTKTTPKTKTVKKKPVKAVSKKPHKVTAFWCLSLGVNLCYGQDKGIIGL